MRRRFYTALITLTTVLAMGVVTAPAAGAAVTSGPLRAVGGIDCNGDPPSGGPGGGTVTLTRSGSTVTADVVLSGAPQTTYYIEMFKAAPGCFPDDNGRVGVTLSAPGGSGQASFQFQVPTSWYNGTIDDSSSVVIVLDRNLGGSGDSYATNPIAIPTTAPPDSDGDGVPDAGDDCPGTPPGTEVDATGCPLVDRYRVEFKSWIPQTLLADPFAPERFVMFPAAVQLYGDQVRGCLTDALEAGARGPLQQLIPVRTESHFLGDSHPDYGRFGAGIPDFRIRSWVEFDWDGQQISNVVGDADAGVTRRTIQIATSLCGQAAVPDVSVVPAAQQLDDDTLRLGVKGYDPLGPRTASELAAAVGPICDVVDGSQELRRYGVDCEGTLSSIPVVPSLDATATVTVLPDGRVSAQFTTDFFPSYGIAVSVNGGPPTSSIVYDGSCIDVEGYTGAANVLVLLNSSQQVSGSGVVGQVSDTCSTAVRRLEAAATERVLRSVLPPALLPVALAVGTRFPLD